ncbi:MAG: N-acetylmuramoyl-L-alanine amidase [Lachnospiraceae bacterium]
MLVGIFFTQSHIFILRKKRGNPMHKHTSAFLLSFVVIGLLCLYLHHNDLLPTAKTEKAKKISILIDAGHGGADPGKVGPDDILEKDINLSIAKKLQKLLKKKGYAVALTRKDDNGVYHEGDRKTKSVDLQNRRNMILSSQPDAVISIHQNSFTSPDVSGAQVFYYEDSAESERLASVMQEALRNELDPENKREIKPDGAYYLLKTDACPMIIVECGFLSNEEEARLLATDEYQNKVTTAIYKGIASYFKQQRQTA